VHWEDGGEICPEIPGDMWYKGFVRQIRGNPANMTDDALFIMDHGVAESSGANDALRFLTSTDLKHWKYSSTSHPDPRWYRVLGRWDHMYMSKDPSGGFIGFAVSTPTVPGFGGTWPGVQRSEDGINWKVEPPLNVTWAGTTPTSIEEGGFERVAKDGKYYLIGGGGNFQQAYSMWVYESDRIDGPYSPLVEGFRLSGGAAGSGKVGWLAAWCGPHCGGTQDPELSPLISNYMTPVGHPDMGRANVWMLPMRKPVVQEGRLRMGYWEANDALQGTPMPIEQQARDSSANSALECDNGTKVQWLTNFSAAEHKKGGVLTATITVSGNGSVGVAMEDVGHGSNPGLTALLLTIGQDGDVDSSADLVHVSNGSSPPRILDRATRFVCGPGGKTCGVATVTGLAPESSHTLRVLFRGGMWEVYVDGILAQTFVYGGTYPLPASGSGRVGLACSSTGKAIASAGATAKAYQMTTL